MRTRKTYFEQIAVETVKKIVQEGPASNAGHNGSQSVVKPNPLDARDRWREIAHQVQEEPDPNKMIALVQQLITTFDSEQRQATLALAAGSRSGLRHPADGAGQ